MFVFLLYSILDREFNQPHELQDQIPCLPARMNPFGRACHAGNATGMTGKKKQ
jgi:hypothetical protein